MIGDQFKLTRYHKVRVISSKDGVPTYGITLGGELIKQFEGLYFRTRISSGGNLVLESGCPV